MRKFIAVALLAYAVMGPVTFGAMMAHEEAFNEKFVVARLSCRGNMGFALAMTLTPVHWFIAFTISGLYEHGFKWRCP